MIVHVRFIAFSAVLTIIRRRSPPRILRRSVSLSRKAELGSQSFNPRPIHGTTG
jgi:hypothetical protein